MPREPDPALFTKFTNPQTNVIFQYFKKKKNTEMAMGNINSRSTHVGEFLEQLCNYQPLIELCTSRS